MTEKAVLVAAVFVYLILVSFICVETFPNVEGEVFGESMFYEPARIQNLSISSAMNLSDLNLFINAGRWVLVNGSLVSDTDGKNEFFIKLYDDGGAINYSISNVTEDFCVYFYRSTSLLGRSRTYRYCFDFAEDLVSFQEVNYYLWVIGGWHIKDSVSFTMTDSHPDVVITLDAIPGGTPEEGGVYSSVSVDGSVLLSENYPEDYKSKGFCAGIFTEQLGLGVIIDRTVEFVDSEEIEMGFDIIPLMLKLILFHAPEIDLPIWLNLIMFKVPVLICVMIVITIARGV